MKKCLNISEATIDDIDTIKYIVDTTIKYIYPHYYPKGVVEFFLNHHSVENIEKSICNEIVLVFKDENEMIGTSTINENEICRLFVLPQYQGCGYGTKIMDYLEKRIKETYSEVKLDSSLPAYDLYIKRGYEAIKNNKIITFYDDVLLYSEMVKRF